MKRFFAAILALIYLATSTGATLHLHYCMGELARINFSGLKTQECPYCGMIKTEDSSKGCCKDEQKQVKLSKDQIVTSLANKVIGTAPVALPEIFIEIPVTFLVKIAESHPLSNSPPDSGGIPIYLQNCNFRI